MKEKILFSSSVFHAFNDAATVIMPMVFPLLYSQKHLISRYSHIGLLSYLGLLTTFVLQIVVVHIADRYEYRSLLALSFAGISASLVLFTLSQNFLTIVLFFLSMRIAASVYHPIGLAHISNSHSKDGIDFAMGVQSASGNLGVLIGFVSMGYLIQRYGWRVPIVGWAAGGVFLGAASFAALRGVSTKRRHSVRFDAASWRESLKRVKKYVPGFIFGGASWSITVFFAPSLLNHQFQIPMGETGLYLGLWIALGSGINYFFGALCRRFGRARVFLAGLCGASVFMFGVGMAGSRSLVVLALLLFGAFLFLIYPSLQSFVGTSAPAERQTQAFSWESNIQMLSGAVVSLGAGWISDRFGIRAPFLLTGILGMAVAAFYLFNGAGAPQAEIQNPES